MAVADLRKLIPEPPSSQVMGLLSVLAISGSVAILTLSGKLRLGATEGHEDQSPESQARTVAELEDTCAPSSASTRSEQQTSSMVPVHKEKVGYCVTGSRSTISEQDRSRKSSRIAKKRVRFAEDVRETHGDSREYRQRYESIREPPKLSLVAASSGAVRHVQSPHSRQQHQRQQSKNQKMPANWAALYRGLCQQRRYAAAVYC
ncbi:hypothetical protein KP509_11G080800 [Ceratopteris richardii]|uniref:Uncharacterized protein n=1 Tax=Ceratopteris richardii TaxID=49495 RepID=A0A8T2TR33_CERRI|nr:hypothetical protein KP509_11G080800 [Ceratopteris richardii]